jgi:hypothetical protein
MKRLVALAMSVAATLFVATRARAADITVVVPETAAHGAVVLVTGRIREDDGKVFATVVDGINDATVYFVSGGGLVSSALAIGWTIRRKSFRTAVLDFQSCFSACALAWLAGTKRFAGFNARIGFHSALEVLPKKRVVSDNFEDLFSWQRSERANKYIANYLTGFLGLPPSAVGYVTEAGRDDLTLLSLERGKEHGIEFERISIPAYNPLP